MTSASPKQEAPIGLLAELMLVPLTLATMAGFGTTFGSWRFLGSAVLGTVGALSVAWLARRFSLLAGERLIASAVAFVLVGGPATSGLPTPAAYADFVEGLTSGWADFLSMTTPVDLTAALRALPYTLCWLGVMVGVELRQRYRHSLVVLITPILTLIATVLLTVEELVASRLGVGIVIAGAAVLLLVGRETATWSVPRPSGAAVASVAWVAALTLGPSLPLANANDRFDLRQLQDRPWHELDQPSPLADLKAALKESRAGEVVFTVSSSTPISRWPIATLSHFDGVVWTVAADERALGSAGTGVARFEPIGTNVPSNDARSRPAEPQNEFRSPVAYQVDIEALGGVWIPSTGTVTTIEADIAVQRNSTTGTIAAPSGLPAGTVFSATAIPQVELTDAELAAVSMSAATPDVDLELLPPRLRNLAGDLFEGVDAGPDRAIAVSNHFREHGFYDAGPAVRPGHSLARIDEFLVDPDRLVGYDEQYAATAALLLRAADVPSRVVVGFLVPDNRFERQSPEGRPAGPRAGVRAGVRAEVLAGDMSAWVEVKTAEHGWVPLSVTPDRSRVPEERTEQSFIQDIVIPSPPESLPMPNSTQNRPTTAEENGDTPTDDEATTEPRRVPAAVATGAVALATPLALLGLGGALVVGMKRRRRRRRRSAESARHAVRGAWRELADRYHELGVISSAAATPAEAVSAYLRARPVDRATEAELRQMARVLDRASFHHEAPDDATVAATWRSSDLISARLRSDRSHWERLAAATDPRPLLRREHTNT